MNREEGAYMEQLLKEKSKLRQTVRTLKSNLEDYKKRLKSQYDLQTEVSKQINLLYFEHDRMSSSGKECLDKLVKSLGMGESK